MSHGYGPYTNGCRCDVCRQANADYKRQRRAAARENPTAESLERHGTRFGFEERGCRCDACHNARAESDRNYWPRRAARLDAKRIREGK